MNQDNGHETILPTFIGFFLILFIGVLYALRNVKGRFFSDFGVVGVGVVGVGVVCLNCRIEMIRVVCLNCRMEMIELRIVPRI